MFTNLKELVIEVLFNLRWAEKRKKRKCTKFKIRETKSFFFSKWCANANMAVGYWTSNIVGQRKTEIVKYLSSFKTKAVTQSNITKKILIPWLLFHWPILSVTFENGVFFQCQSGEKCGKRLGGKWKLVILTLCPVRRPSLAWLPFQQEYY